MPDVAIAGGGPAGATAAILLARAGRSVVVCEKRMDRSGRVCGEHLSPLGWTLLARLGLAERAAQLAGPEIRRVAVWSGGRSLEAPLSGARAIPREKLDRLLLDEAVRCGARVFGGTDLPEARLSVLAHGSPKHHAGGGRKSLLGFKARFGGAPLPGTLALVPFAGGYAGLVETGGGETTFACCIRRDALDALRRPGVPAGEAVLRHAVASSAMLEKTLRDAAAASGWHATGPLRPGVRQCWEPGGRFAVGNAAGEVHPIVGQGISLALASSFLLCDALARTGYRREDAGAAGILYQESWDATLQPRLVASSLFAHAAMQPFATRVAARVLARAPGLLGLAARLA